MIVGMKRWFKIGSPVLALLFALLQAFIANAAEPRVLNIGWTGGTAWTALPDRIAAEQTPAFIARLLQSGLDVELDFPLVERRQPAIQDDPLFDISEPRLAEPRIEFGLSAQNDLQEFAAIGFEV